MDGLTHTKSVPIQYVSFSCLIAFILPIKYTSFTILSIAGLLLTFGDNAYLLLPGTLISEFIFLQEKVFYSNSIAHF